jgi:hypothetical protein
VKRIIITLILSGMFVGWALAEVPDFTTGNVYVGGWMVMKPSDDGKSIYIGGVENTDRCRYNVTRKSVPADCYHTFKVPAEAVN